MEDPSSKQLQNSEASLSAQILLGTSWILAILALLAVSLRFHLRWDFHPIIAWNDWFMLLAIILHFAFQVFLTITYTTGVDQPTKWAWLMIPLVILANITARISIVLVLAQIFNTRRWFRWLIFSSTTIVGIVGCVDFTVMFAMARPIQALWDPRISSNNESLQRPHKILTGCFMRKYLLKTKSNLRHVSNCRVDLVLLAISDFTYAFFPITFIWKLDMPRRKKFGLILVMAGSFVTMAAAIGRAVLSFWSVSADETSAKKQSSVILFTQIGWFWTAVEQSLVEILGNVPILMNIARSDRLRSVYTLFISLPHRFGVLCQLTSKRERENTDSQTEVLDLGRIRITEAFTITYEVPFHDRNYS